MKLNVWGPDRPRKLQEPAYWRQPLLWNRKAAEMGIRHKVFCGSMCDVFEDHRQLSWLRESLWELIEETPSLDWLLLTKRPQNIARMMPLRWWDKFPRNIWLGVSASTQKEFDSGWLALSSECFPFSPSVLFISLEPLLEPISLGPVVEKVDDLDDEEWWARAPDWVIVGAESGPHRRPFDLPWAESIYEECQRFGIFYFGKQASGHRPGVPLLIGGMERKEFPHER